MGSIRIGQISGPAAASLLAVGSIRIGHVGGPATAGLVAVGDTRLVLWTGAALLVLVTTVSKLIDRDPWFRMMFRTPSVAGGYAEGRLCHSHMISYKWVKRIARATLAKRFVKE
ncbi:hypothetical protein [Candidatus Poriferisocius sp.]|uniref:hypothetical protein n=1 Tax=Candidatus Poriferisocius sp. TaxID=3101276 RepID=UPI003B02783D